MVDEQFRGIAAARTPKAGGVRARVLDVSLELFAEYGFDGTTVQQIADRLGVTKAALYYHFESPKDEILIALVAPSIAEFDELLDRYEQMPASAARRRRLVEDYMDYMLRHRRLIAYTVSDIAVVRHPAYATGEPLRRARFAALVAGGDLDFAAQVRVVMAVRAVAGVIATYPDTDSETLRDALLDGARALFGKGSVSARRRASLAPASAPAAGGPAVTRRRAHADA